MGIMARAVLEFYLHAHAKLAKPVRQSFMIEMGFVLRSIIETSDLPKIC